MLALLRGFASVRVTVRRAGAMLFDRFAELLLFHDQRGCDVDPVDERTLPGDERFPDEMLERVALRTDSFPRGCTVTCRRGETAECELLPIVALRVERVALERVLLCPRELITGDRPAEPDDDRAVDRIAGAERRTLLDECPREGAAIERRLLDDDDMCRPELRLLDRPMLALEDELRPTLAREELRLRLCADASAARDRTSARPANRLSPSRIRRVNMAHLAFQGASRAPAGNLPP